MFYSMIGKYKQLSGSIVQYVHNKKVIWKYIFFSTNTTNQVI